MGIRRLWNVWKIFAEKLGGFQARLLMIFLYFVVVTPFALFVRTWKDPLRIKRVAGSNWIDRTIHSYDLEASRRQF